MKSWMIVILFTVVSLLWVATVVPVLAAAKTYTGREKVPRIVVYGLLIDCAGRKQA